MIYTVTFNPALDYIVRLERFREGETNRTFHDEILYGGKGINVSIVLRISASKAWRSASSQLYRRPWASIGKMHLKRILYHRVVFTESMSTQNREGDRNNRQGPDISQKKLTLYLKKQKKAGGRGHSCFIRFHPSSILVQYSGYSRFQVS
jgi:hypothetical protein